MAVWALLVALMVRSSIMDPYDPTLEGAEAYGHNRRGALPLGIAASFVELVVLLAILRPWSYDRSWRRALTAWITFSPWVAFNALFVLHVGGVLALHTLWLFATWIALLGLLVASADRSLP